MTKKKFSLSTTQIIMLSFVAVILVGSLLLSLPISTASGKPVPYVDALFTATTATIEWYTRLGYDEKEIGNGYALMKRETK